jgi:hypothetical protein
MHVGMQPIKVVCGHSVPRRSGPLDGALTFYWPVVQVRWSGARRLLRLRRAGRPRRLHRAPNLARERQPAQHCDPHRVPRCERGSRWSMEVVDAGRVPVLAKLGLLGAKGLLRVVLHLIPHM